MYNTYPLKLTIIIISRLYSQIKRELKYVPNMERCKTYSNKLIQFNIIFVTRGLAYVCDVLSIIQLVKYFSGRKH